MEDMGGWTVTDHLLATLIDAVGAASHHALIGPHADPKQLRKVKPPDRLPRPGAQKKQRRRATSDDMKRVFGGSAAYRPREG